MSGLEYLAIDDEANILPDNGRILQMLLLLLAAATLGMGVAAFFATRKLYTPLRTLMGEFDNPVDARTDECKLLLQSIQSVSNNYASAQNALDYSSPLIRDALLYHLLRDASHEDDRTYRADKYSILAKSIFTSLSSPPPSRAMESPPARLGRSRG